MKPELEQALAFLKDDLDVAEDAGCLGNRVASRRALATITAALGELEGERDRLPELFDLSSFVRSGLTLESASTALMVARRILEDAERKRESSPPAPVAGDSTDSWLAWHPWQFAGEHWVRVKATGQVSKVCDSDKHDGKIWFALRDVTDRDWFLPSELEPATAPVAEPRAIRERKAWSGFSEDELDPATEPEEPTTGQEEE